MIELGADLEAIAAGLADATFDVAAVTDGTYDWSRWKRDREAQELRYDWADYDGRHDEIPPNLDFRKLPKFARDVLFRTLLVVRTQYDAPLWIRTLKNPPWTSLANMIDAAHAELDERQQLVSGEQVARAVADRKDILRVDQEAKEELRREKIDANRKTFAEISGQSIADMFRLPAPPAVIQGVLESASLVRVNGASNAGKTWTAGDMTLSIAVGRDWCGIPVMQGKVVYVAAEGRVDKLSERWAAWVQENNGGVFPTLDQFVPVVSSLQVLSSTFDEMIDAYDMAHVPESERVRLIVFDTQSMVMLGVPENDNTEMNVVMGRLKELAARTGAAVMLLHHTPVGDADRGRGAGAVTGALDSEWMVTQDGTTGVITMRTSKQRDHAVDAVYAWALRRVTVTRENGDEAHTAVLERVDPIAASMEADTADEAALLDAIVAHPGQAKSRYYAAPKDGQPDIRPIALRDPKRLQAARDRLVHSGRAHLEKTSNGSRLWPGPAPLDSEGFAPVPGTVR